jgi:hypothetical protein
MQYSQERNPEMAHLYIGIWQRTSILVPTRAAIIISGDFKDENAALDHAVNRSQFHYCAGRKVYTPDQRVLRLVGKGDFIYIASEDEAAIREEQADKRQRRS